MPLTIISRAFKGHPLRAGGRLGDIAPTALEMMSIEQPEEMTGRSLLAAEEEPEEAEEAGAAAQAQAE